MVYKIAAAQHNNIQQTNSTHFFSFYCILYEDLNLDTMIDLFFYFYFFCHFNVIIYSIYWHDEQIKLLKLNVYRKTNQSNKQTQSSPSCLLFSIFYSLCANSWLRFLTLTLFFPYIYNTRHFFSSCFCNTHEFQFFFLQAYVSTYSLTLLHIQQKNFHIMTIAQYIGIDDSVYVPYTNILASLAIAQTHSSPTLGVHTIPHFSNDMVYIFAIVLNT